MDDDADIVDLDIQVEYVDNVAGIDIAKASAMVCTRIPSKNPARRIQKTFQVGATTQEIIELANHLVSLGIELVVMEATSVYWKPYFFILEAHGLKVWLVNARDVKNVPGRPKTDKLDAIWLAKLTERGMLRPSFVPPKPIRELRDLTRLRKTLVEERARYRQRIEKILEDACIKISDKNKGASDLFGASGRAILDGLVAGERNPRILADRVKGQLRNKIPYLITALQGQFTAHHGHLIATILELHDHLTTTIERLDREIDAAVTALDPTPPPDPDHPHRMPLLERLDEIPGIGRETASAVIAEIGLDMSTFTTPGHLSSWAKLTPRAIQSGTTNTHGPAGKGNRWLKGPLTQAATNTQRTKTFLGARYKRIIKHAPKKKAQTAVARNILEIFWLLIQDPDARFTDLGPDWHEQHLNNARRTRQRIRELENLGYTVTHTTAA